MSERIADRLSVGDKQVCRDVVKSFMGHLARQRAPPQCQGGAARKTALTAAEAALSRRRLGADLMVMGAYAIRACGRRSSAA